MPAMSNTFALNVELPFAADAATGIVRRLVEAGQQALLAGGCVRDLLLGLQPEDYDVATDAPPERICQLFRKTRKVGAQFGVVLVREKRRWVEVATFRSDGEYLDGRRPTEVHFCDAEHDAERRDFTVNGMFLNPLDGMVIDYVGGRADLDARVIRAIGTPADRFAEDHLRLVRAVRFAARLGFAIEPQTFAALRELAPRLRGVAAERVLLESEKMFGHRTRAAAFDLLYQSGLLHQLWDQAEWSESQVAAAQTRLAALPDNAPFTLAFAVMLADRPPAEIESICRSLTCSNEQRERVLWLVAQQADLDDPRRITLAGLKRLMADPGFDELRTWAACRFADFDDGDARLAHLTQRVEAIALEAIQPPPFVTGDDLLARKTKRGPLYKRVLDTLYTRQLDEELTTREQALAALDELLMRDSAKGD